MQTRERSDYDKFLSIPLAGDSAATYLHAYDIDPSTRGLLDALLACVQRVEIYGDYVRAWGGIEETRAVNYDDDVDLALADLLTWELSLGEK